MPKYRSKTKTKRLLGLFLAALLLVALVAVLEKKQIINLRGPDKKTTSADEDAKTTSTAPSAQENFSGGGDRPVYSTDKNEGTVQDNSGNISSVPPKSQWIKSADSSITVYGPAKNSLVKNGESLSGSTSYSQVSFRLIDDISGVIAQGTLSVVNGRFSANINFSTTGTNGRLDVFGVKEDGTELSNIEIPVRFR